MKAQRLIKLIEQEKDWQVKYARFEPTTDSLIRSFKQVWDKLDVQVYDDPQATKKYGRFMWDDSNKPRKGQSSVVMNGYKWNLQWLPNLAELYNGPSWNASQPGYGQGAMTQTIPEGEKTPMVCQECGHRFKKTIGKGTFEVKCPKCGGYDTEPE